MAEPVNRLGPLGVCAEHPHIRDVLLDVCETRYEMFLFPRHRETHVSEQVIRDEVQKQLERTIWFGTLTIHQVDDRWWERMPPPEITTPPRKKEPRVIPPRREPPPPVEKTWFSAQFVDESGLWIDGLSVTMKVGGTSHALTTDKAGVVKLAEQTHSTAVVWVADIPQAEKILVERLERLDEAPAPAGPDVVGYPVEEPAKNVSLSPETPKLIVLGLAPWVGIKLKDQDGNPVTDAAWTVVASDASSFREDHERDTVADQDMVLRDQKTVHGMLKRAVHSVVAAATDGQALAWRVAD